MPELNKDIIIKQIQNIIPSFKSFNDIITICCYCNYVKDSNNEWKYIDVDLVVNDYVTLSHGLCNPCRNILYPELKI